VPIKGSSGKMARTLSSVLGTHKNKNAGAAPSMLADAPVQKAPPVLGEQQATSSRAMVPPSRSHVATDASEQFDAHTPGLDVGAAPESPSRKRAGDDELLEQPAQRRHASQSEPRSGPSTPQPQRSQDRRNNDDSRAPSPVSPTPSGFRLLGGLSASAFNLVAGVRRSPSPAEEKTFGFTSGAQHAAAFAYNSAQAIAALETTCKAKVSRLHDVSRVSLTHLGHRTSSCRTCRASSSSAAASSIRSRRARVTGR
jgi:hypothetical protein